MPETPVQRFSIARSLVFATVIVSAFFGTIELGLRLLGPPRVVRPRILLRQLDVDIDFPFMQPDADTFWSPVPGFEGEFLEKRVTINALGLRGPELAGRKPAGRRRILCLGDSVTFGYGVSDEDTYAAQLGKLLADRGYEVVNGGVTGYTSHQVLARLEKLLPVVDPDLVTVLIGWNDGNLRPMTDREYARRLRQVMAVEGVFDHLYSYRYLRSLYGRATLRAARLEWTTPRVPAEQYRENLRRLVDAARPRGVRVAFLALPHRKAPGAKLPTFTYMPDVENVAREREVPVLDVGELSWKTALESNGAYFIDSIHLSPQGAAALAREMESQLAKLGWI
jgi:lysophospholipase L1-like esterase